MACPFCGDICSCMPEIRESAPGSLPQKRFLPDAEPGAIASTGDVGIAGSAKETEDRETSLARIDTRQSHTARFVVDQNETRDGKGEGALGPVQFHQSTLEDSIPGNASAPLLEQYPGTRETPFVGPSLDVSVGGQQSSGAGVPQDSLPSGTVPAEGSFWKDEVAARLNYYRSRRKPRPPKYPSLRLKFEPGDRKNAAEDSEIFNYASSRDSLAVETTATSSDIEPCQCPAPPEALPAGLEPLPTESARIIAFPRSPYDTVYTYPQDRYELADPVFDTPRIVEVPEVETPAPALGGIMLEPEEHEPEKRPGFELPLQSAAMSRRVVASICDAGVVLAACLLFGYIFARITGTLPLVREVASVGAAILIVFWTAYQYMLLTYAGTTPGLRLAHLQIRQFDGNPASRGMRQWRVFASVLSGLSLGLGYAWCYLDEDALCWHDRITGTYLEIAE